MKDLSPFRLRFMEAPSLLRQRRERRSLRRMLVYLGLIVAVAVGVILGWQESVGTLIMRVGRSLAGLMVFGFAGLMICVLLTVIVIVIYNGIFNGPVSLVDLDFIDEIPLLFACLFGLYGVFITRNWSELLGFVGWAGIAIVLVEVIFRKPPAPR